MAQMEWNKYPEVMPPADDQYLAVVMFHFTDGRSEQRVLPMFFVHDMTDIDEPIRNIPLEHRPCWYDMFPDFVYEDYEFDECEDVLYWMPFPQPPET